MKKLSYCVLLLVLVAACKEDDPTIQPYSTKHTENWMQELIAAYPDYPFTLKDIALPRAHDAGMYQLNNCLGGNACNTQTQYLDMYQMLASGIRVFDVRPVVKDGVFWTYHAFSCNGLGCEGDLFESFLQQTSDYLDEHNELVLFELTHFCNTDPQDAVFLNMLDNILGDKIYKETSATSDFLNLSVAEIIPSTNSRGKIVLLMEGLNSGTENRTAGYFAPSFVPIDGAFANQFDFEAMRSDQLTKFNAFDPSDGEIFKLCWTLTLNTTLAIDCFNDENGATSIELLALDARNRLAENLDAWIANGTITSGKIPNIISVDYANTAVTEQCIKLSKYNLDN